MAAISKTDDTSEKYRAPALEKGLDIIELLAGYADGLNQAEIAKALDRSQSEIYRMLSTLVRRGYVLKTHEGDRYALSLKMFAISQRHPPISRLIEIALPAMRATVRQTWQACHLGMESNGEVVIVASTESPGNWSLALRIGTRIGLWNTGTGRVLAAFRSDAEIDRLIERHEPAVGEPNLDRSRFFEDVARIRNQGYEEMKSETAVGVTNLAFPVFGPDGRAVTVVSCPYLERIDSFAAPSLSEIRKHYAQLASELTRQYGGEAFDMFGGTDL